MGVALTGSEIRAALDGLLAGSELSRRPKTQYRLFNQMEVSMKSLGNSPQNVLLDLAYNWF